MAGSIRLEGMFDGCGQAARRAVNMNIRHGAVAFVEHVFKVQTDAGGFADFVMRSQIQRGVWALGQCFFTGSGKWLVFIIGVCTALPVDVCTQVQTVGNVIRSKEFEQMNGIRRMQLLAFAVFDFRTRIGSIKQLSVAQASADGEFPALGRRFIRRAVVFFAVWQSTRINAQMVAFVHKDGRRSIQTTVKP